MDAWADGWMDGWMEIEWKDGQTDDWSDILVNAWMDDADDLLV